jgi:hypothetical protein
MVNIQPNLMKYFLFYLLNLKVSPSKFLWYINNKIKVKFEKIKKS